MDRSHAGRTSSLVTGGAGFVGCHLVKALIEQGENVVIIDDLSTGEVRNLEHSMASGRVTFIHGDVGVSAEELRAILTRAGVGPLKAIYHLASPASPEAYNAMPWQTLRVNGLGTMALIEIALEHGARFLYSSTSEIYGDPLVHPQPESYFGNVDPIGPRACYDEGKRYGEAAVSVAVKTMGLSGRLVRFFNCYGPNMASQDGRLIPALLEAVVDGRPLPIQGTGFQTRSMTYIDDAIALLLRVMNAEQPKLQPINIGNDDERSVLDIARAMAEVAGRPFEIEYTSAREGDPQRRKPDLTLARAMGWKPTTSLEEGLARTLAWFKEKHVAYV
jgi:nucleoside-diphosphate-sugar epimerase